MLVLAPDYGMTPESNRWEHVQALPAHQFRRLTSVKPATFTLMVEVVNTAERNKKKSGKPHKLSSEDRVLLALEYQRIHRFLYLRDYPTYLRLSVNWGVLESTAKRIQNRPENLLMNDPRFHVLGKKRLLELDVVVVDASERPVEKPKKNNVSFTAARKSSTP